MYFKTAELISHAQIQKYMRIYKRNYGDFWILKCKYYVRYMDDFIILLKTKQECIEVKKLIQTFIDSHLELKLNDKSRYYPYSMGVNFCGYRTFTTHRLLRVSSKTKIKNNVKKWNKLWHLNKLDTKQAIMSINSWVRSFKSL